MFGFLKKLVSKSAPPPPAAPSPKPAPAPQPAVAPAAPVVPVAPAPPVTPAAAPPVRTTPAAQPAASTATASRTVIPPTSSRPAPAPITPAAAAPQPAAPAYSGETLDLPLQTIWSKLAPSVLQMASAQPDQSAMLRIPLQIVLAQLARGAVKIPYAQLRQFSPPRLFPPNAARDPLEVEIPLSEVVSRIRPEMLPRRPDQKKIEPPPDVGNIFGPGASEAHGLRIAEKSPGAARPGAPAARPAVSPPTPAPLEAAPAPVIQPARKVEPAPAPPALPVSAPAPAAQEPVQSISTGPTTTSPGAEPQGLSSEPIRAPGLDPALASLRPQKAEAAFPLELSEVADFWKEKGRSDLLPLAPHRLEIPLNPLEKALKSGKVVFHWRELQGWLRQAPAHSWPAMAEETVIELPLAMIAPRFLQMRGAPKAQKQVQITTDIPDVFAQKTPPPEPATAASTVEAPRAVPQAPSAPASPLPAPQSVAAMPPQPAGTGTRPLLEFGEIFGQPEKKDWTLGEVTQRITTLRGVIGAIIATSDGLLVAGNWPGGVKTESVAAFVPQMYNRMVQCTKELKLGEPGHITLLLENVPLQIFKAGESFLTVLGRAGENLPRAQLQAVALRLAGSSNGN